jgi:hypothetical protein
LFFARHSWRVALAESKSAQTQGKKAEAQPKKIIDKAAE